MKLPPAHAPHDFHHEGCPIVMIEYYQDNGIWMPHEVFVSHAPKHPAYCSHFDFDWCRRDQSLCYHEAGAGPGAYVNGWTDAKRTHAKIWWNAALGVNLRTGGGGSVEDFAALGFEYITHPLKLCSVTGESNPFAFGSEGEVVYCTECRDHLPEDNPCPHIFWCDLCNEWGGAASDKERCRHRKPSTD